MINELKSDLTDPPHENMIDVIELSARRRNSRLLLEDTDHSSPDAVHIDNPQRTIVPPTDRCERLIINKDTDSSKNNQPIIGYAEEPILSLIDACIPLVNIVPDIMIYAQTALELTPNQPADNLTRDESASIRLYTMEWKPSHESLYLKLNHILRTSDRENLCPWFKYLKLFLTAIVKIPCIRPQTVWRGVKKNISDGFPKGAQVIWWTCSSTTTSLNVLQSDLYLGTTGARTLFSIEVLNGRSICNHSHYNQEEEILLLPGTYMEVQSQLHPSSDLHIIHLKQIVPNEILLEPPFADANLYPKPSRPWYKTKRFLTSLTISITLSIVAIILIGVLAHKHGAEKAEASVNWYSNNTAMFCDFINNDLLKIKAAAQICGPMCAKTRGCTHFTWSAYDGGTCWMKEGNISKNDAFVTNDATMICGIIYHNQTERLNSTVTWNENNTAMSCDFINNDLLKVKIEAQFCGSTCAQTDGCTHFTWSSYEGGTCWMKYGNISKNDAFVTNDATMICGIIYKNQTERLNLTVTWNENNTAMSCDFLKNDLLNVKTSSESCRSTCVQTDGCTHFSWSSYEGGTCWMKYGIVSKNDALFTNDPTMICGVIDFV